MVILLSPKDQLDEVGNIDFSVSIDIAGNPASPVEEIIDQLLTRGEDSRGLDKFRTHISGILHGKGDVVKPVLRGAAPLGDMGDAESM